MLVAGDEISIVSSRGGEHDRVSRCQLVATAGFGRRQGDFGIEGNDVA